MTLNNCPSVLRSVPSFLLLGVHHMVLRLALQVVIQWTGSWIVSSQAVLVMQVVHGVPAVVVAVLVPVHVWILCIVSLLVVPDHVLHVANPDTEDHIHAVLELSLTEDFILVEHLEVTAKGQKTVATGLMLWSYSAATDFIAQLCQPNIFQRWNVLNDVLQVINYREVKFHWLVKVINRQG